MEQIITFSFLFLLVLALSLVVILSPIIFQQTTPVTNLQGSYNGVGVGSGDHHKSSQDHTRPICADSSVFRAEFEGELRSCAWISHDPVDRCDIKGTDVHGNVVPAKEACFEACDTGNCRRRK
jgi:hypothetical protein